MCTKEQTCVVIAQNTEAQQSNYMHINLNTIFPALKQKKVMWWHISAQYTRAIKLNHDGRYVICERSTYLSKFNKIMLTCNLIIYYTLHFNGILLHVDLINLHVDIFFFYFMQRVENAIIRNK